MIPEGSVVGVNSHTTALLIIDVQNDYANENGFMAKWMGEEQILEARKIIPPLRRLIEVCNGVGMSVIWVQSTRNEKNCEVNRHRILPARLPGWIGGPREDTWGAEIIDEIRPGRSDVIVEKHRNSAFYETDLQEILKERKIDTLVHTGIATSGCVESTMRDAFHRDYDIILLSDCCSDPSRYAHRATIRKVRDFYGAVWTSGQLIKKIAKPQNVGL